MIIILIIFVAGCILAAILTTATTVLSSRITHSQPVVETYEVIVTRQNGVELTPRTYPIKVKA